MKTTARKGLVFEDEVILVMNKEDLTNVCVLAVDGFGEEEEFTAKNDIQESKDSNPINEMVRNDATYRGQKEWKDAVGGASICCSVCCAILGNVSPCEENTVRLLKHRLSLFGSIDGIDYLHRNSCGTFVAKELVRYVENQAIFTFAVHGYIHRGISSLRKCILIKVLSWNTEVAVKDETEPLTFRNTVKVLYEIIDVDKSSSLHEKKPEMATSSDPMSFSWGGIDSCCPPNNTSLYDSQSFLSLNMRRSSVNMYLYGDDWLDLKRCLRDGNQFFSKELSIATTQLKLGREEGRNSNALLSFLQL